MFPGMNSAAVGLAEVKGGEVEGLRWFDWSEVGPWEPTTDLAQTLISDVKAAIFVQHSRALLRALLID